MKKFFLSFVLASALFNQSKACAWYDPDYDYFNLFTQNIIRDKSLTPFLLTYSSRFYEDEKAVIPNENIESWQKYFGNQFNYRETEYLVNHLPLQALNAIKTGKTSSEPILAKLGNSFYNKYKEGIDYLIEAKYLEPYMRISYVESPDSFYYRSETDNKNATNLDYDKTLAVLNSLYNSARNPDIKLRYGYQLVRFNHYTRHFEESINAFKKYVEPLNINSAPYYLALDQFAGAERGLGKNEDANWHFFQVFMNSKSLKRDAFVSMKLSDSASFNNILKRAGNDKEKTMAYFLLGYQDFNDPLPMMKKIYDIDPESEMLKVLGARAINELERNYLPVYYYQNPETQDTTGKTTEQPKVNDKENSEKQELSLWQRIVRWFKSIFGSKSSEKIDRSNDLSDKQYLENPDRIPFYNKAEYSYYNNDNDKPVNYLSDLEDFTDKIKDESKDEFWKIADAYLKFLQKDYEGSSEVLSSIKTNDKNYQSQIQKMKMLNDIVSQPKISSDFEEHLYKDYREFFEEKPKKMETDSTAENFGYEEYTAPSTQEFLKDILANRYFLQGDDAKSFLMNNQLSDLRFNPNLNLAKKLQAFFNKKDKSTFESQIIAKNINNVGDTEAFFNLIYGDFAMRNADFANAKKYYEKAVLFSGIPLPEGYYDYNTGNFVKYQNTSDLYNGFSNISGLIFGHNVWESYQSPDNISMKTEDFINEFPFIKQNMNKLELADAVLKLKQTGKSKGEISSKANQLIGNLLYNTSVLGYYREVFVMDTDNSNGVKYYFGNDESPFRYYYKNYGSNVFIKPDNFDLSIQYYSNALQNSGDKEQKARILFQMASAEQGKYYQWEARQPSVSYDDKNWEQKSKQREIEFANMKNEKFRTYFTQLKQNFKDTEAVKSLSGSCSYFDYFMKK